jgi:flavin reductase (DIM6/NTAB) family NADH-FMN oxidoreductase RutF
MDKFAACGLRAQEAEIVKAPLVAGAVANFECRLVEIRRPGDCPLIVGRVVAAHVNKARGLRRLFTVAPGHKLAGVRRA